MVKKIFKIVRLTLALLFASSLLAVVAYRFVPVYFTPLMLTRCFEQIADGRSVRLHHEWIPLERMARSMPVAVIASEDQRFMEHHGFDYKAIEQAALEHLDDGKRLRGGSTISQQTAKNVFCLPARTWLRKGVEAWFTVLIETFWSKRRIMEVYLNVVETGRNMYGVEAPARDVYGKTAAELNAHEASMIATVLPNPLRRDMAAPSGYMVRRAAQVRSLMGKLGPIEFDRPEGGKDKD